MSMKLPREDRRHLDDAEGYLLLEMLDDANVALDRISAQHQASVEVLTIRQLLLHERKDWKNAVKTARQLVSLDPSDAGWVINWAYATRRAQSIDDAHAILLEGQKRHPDHPLIHYNLGCYAAQKGRLDEALKYVRKAIQLDSSFRKMALEDADLEPIRDQLGSRGLKK